MSTDYDRRVHEAFSICKMMELTGGFREIKDAKNSDDFAVIARATYAAFQSIRFTPTHEQDLKSAYDSNYYRIKGNSFYNDGDHDSAVFFYNKALMYAPNNSIEIKLAHANLSAVMFTIKAYQASLDHINACFALGCPRDLKEKLDKRIDKAKKLIDSKNSPGNDPKKQIEFILEKNPEIPCASKDVDFLDKDGTKKVVVAKEIKSGTVVAMERAFVSAQADDKQFLCYYCHKTSYFFTPCDVCSKVVYCSEDCRKICFDEYHRIECQIIGYMCTQYVDPLSKLMIRTAIKMSLKLSWEELSAASKIIGEKRFKNSSIKSAFDVNDPLSMLSYGDQNSPKLTKKEINYKAFTGSLTGFLAIYGLERVPNYFPEGDQPRKEAIDAISRIMLQLYATFPECINIHCHAYDTYSNQKKSGVNRNVGWFSFTSKLKHSYEPNLAVSGLNNYAILTATRTIKKGEELTINVDLKRSNNEGGLCESQRCILKRRVPKEESRNIYNH